MSTEDVRRIFQVQRIDASPVHVDAAAAVVDALLEATARRFAMLPLEAEPSTFQAELGHSAS